MDGLYEGFSEPCRHCRADQHPENIMLNKSERFQILEILKHLSVLGPLPVEVDLKNWRLKVSKIKQLWICALVYILHVIHVLFKLSSLVYNILFVPDLKLHQVMVHAVVAFASAMCTFWYFKVYVKDPGLFSKYAELTLVGHVGGTPDLNYGVGNHWTRRLSEYSMQDLIALTSPYLIILSIVATISTYIYDPTMQLLLYKVLPTYLQNWVTFGILLVEELRFLMMNTSVSTPIWQLQVTSFDLVSNQLLALKRKIENGTVTGVPTYKTLRSLQLYVTMFNEVNRYLIFTWKLFSITGAVLAGFAAIAHFHEHSLFGLMYYVILTDCVFFYAVIYQKAFKIPQLFDETASRALLHMGGSRRDGFRKKISSTQPAAITVGRFHKLERASTMIYINFVVTNIVSMLVGFR